MKLDVVGVSLLVLLLLKQFAQKATTLCVGIEYRTTYSYNKYRHAIINHGECAAWLTADSQGVVHGFLQIYIRLRSHLITFW